ncbi:MAG: 3-phosphoserine/phosphohydroxythreonine transaminase [Lewinellaceae bacterium]|nr:3-phosphoserine/phosphohydroxythreonine transaminase [Lewinellaceae bacterium]
MKYNFSAGPAILPKEVMEEAGKAAINFNNSGLSILEISHRSKDFIAVMDQAVQLVKDLLSLSSDYEVIFISGGASSQFFMVPMNFLDENGKAAYVDSGVWANKAIKEAKLFGQVDVVASSKDENYSYIPKGFSVDSQNTYLHLTSNNTIYGTQLHHFPETEVPLIADMSSDIFSRAFDVNKFDLIYAGAQKNMGPAGTTLVIVKKSALGKVRRSIPSMLKYETHIDGGSMYNTPPVFPIYVSMLTMQWLKNNGGIEAIQKINEEKAALLYNEIDRNPLFVGTARKEDRSNMNVCFLLKDSSQEPAFNEMCKSAGCVGLAGHRSVGGFRASIYNAMPKDAIQVLVDIMREFERKNG